MMKAIRAAVLVVLLGAAVHADVTTTEEGAALETSEGAALVLEKIESAVRDMMLQQKALQPKLRAAIVPKAADTAVRGRMLAEAKGCQWTPDDGCDLSPNLLGTWEPKSEGGKKFKSAMKESVTCEAKATSDCASPCEIDDGKCTMGMQTIMSVMESDGCATKQKQTFAGAVTDMTMKCTVHSTQAACGAAADCKWEMGSCEGNMGKMMGQIMPSTSWMGAVLQQGSTCKAQPESVCTGNCSYDATEKQCEASTSYMSAVGGTKFNGLVKDSLTCMFAGSDATKCGANKACTVDDTSKSCKIKPMHLAEGMSAGMEGPWKDFMIGSMVCGDLTKDKCDAEPKCKYAMGSCSSSTDTAALMMAPMPGGKMVCPSMMSVIMTSMATCSSGADVASCNAMTDCEWDAEDSGCTGATSAIYKGMMGADDAKIVGDASTTCGAKTTKADCESATVDLGDSTSGTRGVAAFSAALVALGLALLM